MKKTLTLVLLAGLMLTGCGSKQASVQSSATAMASAPAEGAIEVPDVVGLTLDKATDQLQDLRLKARATDVDHDKTIMIKKNWQVVSTNPLNGAKAAEGSIVELGVRHLTDEAPTPTPAQAEPVVPVAPPVVMAPPAPPVAPPAPPVAPPVYGGIICKDGYSWPGTTRQGACRGHGGIAN